MLHKNSKPSLIKFIKRSAAVLFVAEAAAFGISYCVWHRMNTNRDFRQYIGDNYPIILQGYYSFGELMNGGAAESATSIRNIDAAYWEHEPKTK